MADEDYRQKLKSYKRSESKQTERNEQEGSCDLCGEWSSRLLDGVCPPCRKQWDIK